MCAILADTSMLAAAHEDSHWTVCTTSSESQRQPVVPPTSSGGGGDPLHLRLLTGKISGLNLHEQGFLRHCYKPPDEFLENHDSKDL